MKKNFYFAALLLAVLSFTNSQAQAVFPDADSVAGYLAGTWKWDQSCGGFAGGCTTPTTPGSYQRSLVFSRITNYPDSLAYSYYTNGTLTATGGSKINFGASIFGNGWILETINYSPGFATRIAISIAKADSVWLADDCNDCFLRNYSRVKATPVGINKTEAQDPGIGLFPNPATNRLQLRLKDNLVPEQAWLYDALGKRLPTLLKEDLSIDVAHLPAGLYLLSLETIEGHYQAKFIKE